MSELFESPAPAFDAAVATELLRDHFGIAGSATLLVSERDQNFRIDAHDGSRYLLKIANAVERPDVIDYENAILGHIRAVAPEIPVPRLVEAPGGSSSVQLDSPGGSSNIARVLTWLGGTTLRNVDVDAPLQRRLGRTLAELGLALRGFFHPSAAKPLLWDITQLEALRGKVEFVEDSSLRTICAKFIDRFAAEIAPELKKLRAQVIYNDLNPSNVLVSEDDSPRVTGIVDFGDTVHAPLICDVAVAAAYQVSDGNDPLEGVLEFTSAYHGVVPLEAAELGLLPDLIIARTITTVVVANWRASIHPENRDYILRNADSAARNLSRLDALDRATVDDRIRRACPVIRPAAKLRSDDADAETLLQRRKLLLGSAYRLFYERPVHIVRGENVWLFDPDGRAYLDAYNNVPLVGHCHPQVVAALSAQAATLNTHTRYLHDGILEYAERLLSLFPTELNRVMFGCTGSEANELALRIARTYTGNTGVIATKYAYHGNTVAIAQLSPSYNSAEVRDDWVEAVAPPDTYRADSDEAVCARFLNEIDAAIQRLAERGIAPAALILDAGFTSDGMYPPPAGLMAEAAKRVRAAGGIFIADEVQAGFARLGETLWGFQRDDLVPDIVTLGKPIGNGHPLAATIIKHDILDAFSGKARYFNTFGGNPVSAAVGLAVLDVFEGDELATNSLETGRYLHERLHELSDRHALIGDVRGSGLFAGVELVIDNDPDSPATDAAKRVVNGMRGNGVLISMIGPDANTLKIRPPLPFQRRHVDRLIDTLDRCLASVADLSSA